MKTMTPYLSGSVPAGGPALTMPARNQLISTEIGNIWNDPGNINKSIYRKRPQLIEYLRIKRERKGLDSLAPHERMALRWADRDPPLRDFEGPFLCPYLTEQLPLSQKMVRAIVEAQAAAKGAAVSDLSVVVAFHGANAMEAMLWVETGARVIAADMGVTANFRLKRRLKKMGYDELPPNLTLVNPSFRRKPRGDIVTAGHPNSQLSFRPWKEITAYGKEDSIYIIQSDFETYIEPFLDNPLFEVLFSGGVNEHRYFYPSWFLRSRYSWLLIAAAQREPRADQAPPAPAAAPEWPSEYF